MYGIVIPCASNNNRVFCTHNILLTKTTAARNAIVLSYHRVHGLYFLAVVFVRSSNRCAVKSHYYKPIPITLVLESSTMELSFMTGCKGGCNDIWNGHVYIFDRKKASGVMHRTLQIQCKARLYTQEKTCNDPSHPSSATNIETVSKIKNYSSTKLPGQVVRDVIVETSDDVKVALPTCTNFKAKARRYQRKINNVPANSIYEYNSGDSIHRCTESPQSN